MTKKIDKSFVIKSLGVSVLLIALILLPLFFYSCKETSTGPTIITKSSPAQVSGKVYGKGTVSGKVQQLIAGVTVTLQAQGDTIKQSYTTRDSTGYQFTVAFSDSPATKSVTLILAMGGYYPKTSTYNVSAGQNTTTWRDTLADTTSLPQPGQGSGSAANLVFISSTSSYANVHGAGGIETATFTFEARDSLGAPVDILHQAKVGFRLIDSTGGGEFLTPLLDSTGITGGRHGRVWTTLNVGNRTGIVQVQAWVVNKPSVSATSPAFPIYGGSADLAHFSIGVDRMNFPALGLIGVQNKVTVQIGDKWGNPVRQGTPVLFGTSAGVIQALDSTDNVGKAQVILTSGNPQPANGYDIVTATTTGDTSHKILQKPVVILWSGPAKIDSVKGTDTSFTVRSNGALGVTYRVYDSLKHPLAQGTQIAVTVVGDGASHLATSGDLSAILPDTQDSSYTKFHIQLQDTSATPAAVDKQFFIVINVTGPNGTAQKIVSGTLRGSQGGSGTVGKPASIVLASVSPGQISVKGSGGPASTVVTFLVLDRNGHSVAQNSALVKFRVSNLAGVTLYPDTIRTDVLGRVQTTITSGTQAGVVQVVASTDTGGGNFISSSPVPITVAGGLPDAAHFTLAVTTFNVPGLVVAGKMDTIAALVGDMYANPVQDNTAVYFTTTGGITTPTGNTKGGLTSSTLITGNPNPVGGIDTVTATTINKDSVKITGMVRVIFSGFPRITSVDTVVINDGATVPVAFRVADLNGNPVSAGTTITAALQGDQSVTNQLQLTGDLSTTLADHFSGGAHITDFSVTIRDTGVGDLNQGPFKLIVSVSGPNGSTAKNVVGILKPSAAPIVQRIALISAGDRRLVVKNTPGIDSSIFVFEIQDNLDRPIPVKVPMDFLLTGAPGTFSPARALTDSLGNAKTIFYSGTDTGSVSIQAEYGNILSAAQNLIILPGPASAVRLSLTKPADSTNRVNFPGAVFTRSDKIGEAHAVVTDVYGNPVAVGTPVGFSSNGGYINPTGYTNASGLAKVDWFGGAPTPVLDTVTAIVGPIKVTATAVYSGAPLLSISGAPLPNPLRHGIDTIIIFRVKDNNGNPLAQGTTVHLGVSGSASNYVVVSGDTTLPDTKDTAYTYISYHVRDTNTVILENRTVSFTLSVSGPNGPKQLPAISTTIQGAVPPPFSVLALVGITASNLSVKGVGQTDTSTTLTYELQDSSHRTIRTSGVQVLFRFLGVAGRFDSSTAVTDANGHAKNTFYSDIVAETAKVQGVAQGIQSQLQSIVIQGGPPSQGFFSFTLTRPPDSVAKVNFPGAYQVGQNIGEAIVRLRDRYGNIVPAFTPVNFGAAAGTIAPTGYTDQNGVVNATWLSGGPPPQKSVFVWANTQGQSNVIRETTFVVYSGQARILGGISGSLNMHHGIDTTISYTVQDDSLNPLAQGTTIQVSVSGDAANSLVLSGDKNVTLSDTKLTGSGTTSFKFRLKDTSTATFTPLQANVTIQVSGPNGTATQATTDTLQGAAAPRARSIASVNLVSASRSVVTVKDVGEVETSLLTYEIRDSLGQPVQRSGETVRFVYSGVPGTFTPDTTTTDASGRVYTTFRSGILAGDVDVTAIVISNSITSSPVKLTVVGGPPDQGHFTVMLTIWTADPKNPEFHPVPQVNFAGAFQTAQLIGMGRVLVGDKYSNPVPKATPIYFKSNAGVIGGIDTTDARGLAVVDWLGGNPLPPGGIAVVTASALGQNGVPVVDSASAVFSGQALISGNLPANFVLRSDIDTVITYKVADASGNPIAPGSAIQVSLSGTSAPLLSGNVNFTMPDTRDTNAAKFSFEIKDTNTVITGQRSLTVSIQVNGPNGTTSQVVNGSVRGVLQTSGRTRLAASVAIISVTPTSIQVAGTGGIESASIVYEIRDSVGVPVDSAYAVTFSLLADSLFANPPGGAFISPPSGLCDPSTGRIAANIHSGTVSGAVQAIASLTLPSGIVKSIPVRILIYGGFPDLAHFSLGASQRNIAGLDIIGNVDTLTAIVGDKYGNPVPPGTAVYFTTGIGIINTSLGYTNANGFARAVLFSGNPIDLPDSGFGYARAATIGQAGQTISDSIRLLFSGLPGIVIDSVSNGASAPFAVYFHVWDQEFHHPLASTTTISIGISGASAVSEAILPISSMPDVMTGFTTFSVQVIADIHATPFVAGPFTGTISVNGPNGSASLNFSGIVP